MEGIFKTCTSCKRIWLTRADMLGDPAVTVVGYQVNFDDLMLGYFLFNDEQCGTTMAVPAGLFAELCGGPIFDDRRTGKDDCTGYCLHEDELRPCPAKCECAYVRDVLQAIRNWPKTNHTPAVATEETS